MPYQTIVATEVKDVFKIQPKVFGDERGWYVPELELSELENAIGQKLPITQIASSYNSKAGILRGLHYQLSPQTQGKLVQATRGSVLDVALDIRQNSPTFGKFVAELLTSKDHNQLWVPPGCAHGYLALEADTIFSYVVTNGTYDTTLERGINPFDPDLNIPWNMERSLMDLKDRDLKFSNLSAVLTNDLL